MTFDHGLSVIKTVRYLMYGEPERNFLIKFIKKIVIWLEVSHLSSFVDSRIILVKELILVSCIPIYLFSIFSLLFCIEYKLWLQKSCLFYVVSHSSVVLPWLYLSCLLYLFSDGHLLSNLFPLANNISCSIFYYLFCFAIC